MAILKETAKAGMLDIRDRLDSPAFIAEHPVIMQSKSFLKLVTAMKVSEQNSIKKMLLQKIKVVRILAELMFTFHGLVC